ncbi:MAG TPA: cytochrome c peroxidase [Candidatus Brocadia sapporoensis]|nr:cytochrome-c peroxidase [Candidatus Brocadia sp.]HQU31272.1 cytochrome c peroxidase [Candidatus Brocadia sapporoensis]
MTQTHREERGNLMQRVMEMMIHCFMVYCIFCFLQPAAFPQPEGDSYALSLPPGVLEPVIPENNPLTKEKIALGRNLYFDKRLSADDTISCATCHDPQKGFADGRAVAVGIKGQKGPRNSPTVLNAAFFDTQFWDGRALTLEDQAKQPIINPKEMGMPSHDALVEKISNIPGYRTSFKTVFGTDKITIDHIVTAIASFERTLISFNAPFDRFIAGKNDAISDSAQRGWKLFQGKARCITCHEFNRSYPFFTNNKFHNVGVAMKGEDFGSLARKAASSGADPSLLAQEEASAELGRYLVTKEPKDIGAFKTSGLRNIALTAPYMHDGSELALESVIEFYNKGGVSNPNLDGGIRPLNLTEDEKKDLVEFMKSLTSDDLPESGATVK